MAKIGYGSTFGLFIALISIVLGGLFVYKSFSSVMQLRPDPPAEFLDPRPDWTRKQREAEDRLARAYWATARKLSRSVYGYSDRLPADPPATFSVDERAFPSLVEPAAAARARYWRNLHKVWNHPGAWKNTYEWHTSWFFQGTSY